MAARSPFDGRLHETGQQIAVRILGHREARALLLHARLRPVHQLTAARFRSVQHRRDVGIIVVEHLAHQERGAFIRRQALQHPHEGHRHLAGQFGGALRGALIQFHQRLGQPPADVGFALGFTCAQAVDGQACGDRDQPRLGRLQCRRLAAVPAQPGILHHVLRVGPRSQHAVGDRKQPGPHGGEGRFLAGAGGRAHL